MYYLLRISDVVRIPPDKFSEPLEEIAFVILREKYEGLIDSELGIIIAISNLNVSDFLPHVQEVIEGEIVEVTDFGAFMRLGPVDGLIHVSQVMDDYIVYDKRRGALMGKESQRILQEGDLVRARIVTVSLSSRGARVGLTMRQPFLGVLSWIDEDLKRIKGEVKSEAKK